MELKPQALYSYHGEVRRIVSLDDRWVRSVRPGSNYEQVSARWLFEKYAQPHLEVVPDDDSAD